MIELYWPLIAGAAGFAQPDRPPVFLTLETAQYFMARIVRPMLEAGRFDSIRVDRNRLYSQILDNLNKAAVVGFDATEIGPRLKAAGWANRPTAGVRRGAGGGKPVPGSTASSTTCWTSRCSTRCLPGMLWPLRPVPRVPALALPAPDRRQHRGGHAGQPRHPARVAAAREVGAGGLRHGRRIPPFPGRGPGERLPAEGAVPGAGQFRAARS